MKVLFVTNDAWFFVSHRLPIGKALVEAGHKAVVVARTDDTVPQIIETGCEFNAWRVEPRGKSIVSELRALQSLARIIRAHKPDVVHLITIKPVLYGGLISRMLRVSACVYAISGLGTVMRGETPKAKLLRTVILPFYRMALRHRNSLMIFQNLDDRDVILNRLKESNKRARLIRGSGVRLANYIMVPEPAGTPIVTMAARLLKDKGVNEFVAAANILAKRGIAVRFKLAGGNLADGNPASFSSAELDELGANELVEVLGHCDDIPTLFAESTVVVLPSYREGLPKVLVEAGAAGRPVVTTDVPGCRDAVSPGESALLVPVKDSVALADAIQTLLNDQSLRIKLGKAGRALVESEMQIETIVAKHLSIYQELTA